MHADNSATKNRFAAGVLAATVVLLLLVANLPYKYVEREGEWIGGQRFGDAEVGRHVESMPVMAGWPLRYSIYYEFEATGIQNRFWSPRNLCVNVVAAIVICLAVYCFTLWRSRTIDKPNQGRSTRIVFDSLVAFLILLVPATAYGLLWKRRSDQLTIVRSLSRNGNCYVAAWLPEPIVNRVPKQLADVFMRVRQAKLYSPDDDLVRKVARFDSLDALEITSGTFEADSIAPLTDSPHLESIGLYRQRITQDTADTIAKMNWLRRVAFAGSNLTSTQLHALDSLQYLKEVDVHGTNIRLAELGKPKWSESVEQMWLPRPHSGQSDSLTLHGWPKLKSLSVSRFNLQLNEQTLDLSLKDLPRLEVLRLNRVQKHALQIHDAPRLMRIDEDVQTLFFALGADDKAPGLTWVVDADFKNLPSMRRISCFGADLRSLKISNLPGLRHLELGAYFILSGGLAVIKDVDQESVQSWIDSIGESSGPVLLDLTGLSLDGIDLSPLVKNQRLRRLRLGHTGVTFQQLQSLDGMRQLDSLAISDCSLEGDELSWIVEAFPQLRDLAVNVAALERFDLVKNDLKFLRTSRYEKLAHLRLEEVPNLNAYFHLAKCPDQLVIRDAPQVRGFALESPWPVGARLEGLRDLEWFSIGGGQIDDSVVEAVLDCPKIDRITLAYPSISKEALKDLGELTELTTIEVPGAEVDDDVTDHWRGIRRLNRANFADTKIAAGTLYWLSGIESMRELSLRRVTLSDEAADALTSLTQLTYLDLSNAEIDDDALIRLLRLNSLEELDLSGWSISEPLMDAIVQNQALVWVKLDRCDLGRREIDQLLTREGVAYEFGEEWNAFSDELKEKLDSRKRSNGYVRRQPFRAMVTTDQAFQLIDSSAIDKANILTLDPYTAPGYIDAERFRTELDATDPAPVDDRAFRPPTI